MYENWVVRRIFGPMREEVVVGWRRLHNVELHNLYASSSVNKVIKSRKIKWTGHVPHMGQLRNAYNIVVGKPEGMRPLQRPRHRREGDIKMDLREIGWEDAE
jgi:hypothetical protein